MKYDQKNFKNYAGSELISSIVFVICIVIFTNVGAQSDASLDFDKVKIGDVNHVLVGLDLSPDQKYLAISSIQNKPLYIYDWSKREIIKEFDVGNWYAGSAVRFSPNGKYILIRQMFYVDWAPNKDKEVKFELIDSQTGNILKTFDGYHAMSFCPDGEHIASLTGEEIAFWNLNTLDKDKTIKVELASNGFAISPDGKFLAVSHHPNEEDLKKQPKFKKDKNALKFHTKYKQQISIIDLETSAKVNNINQFYDIVYRLEFSADGKILFCQQVPHAKAIGNQQQQTYVNMIDAQTWEPLRRGFISRSLYEPEFKLSHDGKLFGLISMGSKFVELHIYDFASGTMLHRFEQSYRFFEKTDGELAPADVRSTFVFLPDNKHVIMTMGSRLIYWNMEP